MIPRWFERPALLNEAFRSLPHFLCPFHSTSDKVHQAKHNPLSGEHIIPQNHQSEKSGLKLWENALGLEPARCCWCSLRWDYPAITVGSYVIKYRSNGGIITTTTTTIIIIKRMTSVKCKFIAQEMGFQFYSRSLYIFISVKWPFPAEEGRGSENLPRADGNLVVAICYLALIG